MSNQIGSERIFGLAMEDDPLPEGYMPVEGLVILEMLDSDGKLCWGLRGTSGLSTAKRMGMLHIALQLEERGIWRDDDDE